MLRFGDYEFKIAETVEELDQVHGLNYRTFVQEIHQHEDSGSGVLVDKFHRKNSYIIGLRDNRLIGMISFHDQPPFSVADRLADASILASPGMKPIEVRLLAVDPEERNSVATIALVWCLYQHVVQRGYTHLLISGVAEQENLYTHIGFVPMGPPVGTGRACYIPMWGTLERIGESMGRIRHLWAKRLERQASAR